MYTYVLILIIGVYKNEWFFQVKATKWLWMYKFKIHLVKTPKKV